MGLVPPGLRGRVYGLLRGRPWRGLPVPSLVLWFWVSAALGAATHVVWDAFTHPGRWGVRLLPVLGETAAGFPLYYYAQYGSSALALVVVAVFLVSAVRRSPDAVLPVSVPRPAASGRFLAVTLLGLCAAVGAVHRCVRRHAATGWDYNLVDYTPTAVFGAGAGLAAGLAVHAAAVRAHRWRPSREPPGTEPAPRPGGTAAAPAAPAGPHHAEAAGSRESPEAAAGAEPVEGRPW
ncbi:DUF4184 family protein [Streptomyces sp. F63]|nr:DUF4184 family protein [Streptomyces sp. F63]